MSSTVPQADPSGSQGDNREELCLQLEQLKEPQDQDEFLDAHPELLQKSTLHFLAESIRTWFRVDVPRALRLAEASLLIASRLDDRTEYALALRAKANALSLGGQHREALTLFDAACTLFDELGEQEEVGRTLSTSIRSSLLVGEYDSAFQAANRARSIFERLGETLRIARLDINVANIYHRQNYFLEALEVYERAYEQLLPHSDFEGIGVALHNVAVCRIALDDFKGALEAYQRLRNLCEIHNMPLLVAQADYNSAYLYFLRGDYTRALTLLQATRELYRNNSDDYHQALCDVDQAEIYIELGMTEEAADMARSSYTRFASIETGFEVGRSLAALAIALGQQGLYSQALEAFAEAREIFSAENNLAWPSLLDLYRSFVLCKQGKTTEAAALCQSTLQCFQDAGMPGKELQALLLLGRIGLQSGDLTAATEYCSRALAMVQDLDLPSLGFQAWLLQGEIHEAAGRTQAALEAYQACRETLEDLRGGLQADELKIGLLKDRVKVYERLVHLNLQQDSSDPIAAEKAFAYIEEARSRSLRDLVFRRSQKQQHRGGKTGDADSPLGELRQQLNWYYNRIEREQLSREGLNAVQLKTLREQARVQERELLRLERESSHAWDHTGKAGRSRAASLDEVQQSVGQRSVLVEYFWTREQLLAAVISAGKLHIGLLASLEAVQKDLRFLDFQLKKFRLGRAYSERFARQLLDSIRVHLRSLFDAILKPVLPHIEADHLVIVPWGPLHQLPFHALLDGDRYLIENFAITYAPSASIYSLRRSVPNRSHRRSLVIGVASESTPQVVAEATAVAAAVPHPELLLGSDATEANLRAKGPDSALIHIATHGYFRQDNPMFSSIRLADSYLSLYDLYDMELPVNLLTLSGCVTGTNAVAGGDELIGLARGLFFAGAQSLLLSLWDVDDQSTSDLMTLFYRALQQEPRKSRALQTAMVQSIARNPHPYYWAAFKLTSTAQSEFPENFS